MIQKVQGTLDYFGDDIIKFNYIIDEYKRILKLYNYEEFITPIIEYAELFNRCIGSETDIVEKEMYIFNSSTEKQIALRPENTAGIIRAYIENNLSFVSGLKKFFYVGPMFRHERPQKGRLRQFYQLGCEAIGSSSPWIDAEVIITADKFLKRLGLDQIELNLNSIGCAECRKEYLEKLKNYYSRYIDNICMNCKNRLSRNPLRVLDCKEEKCSIIKNNAPAITDFLCKNCEENFKMVLSVLEKNKINFIINKFLVRGLDYYTNTTFEFLNKNLGSQNAVLAGGRYNNLIQILGGNDEPAVGFAAGLERLIISLSDKNIKSDEKKIFIATYNKESFDYAFELSEKLRDMNNLCVEMNTSDRSLKAQLRTADKFDFDYLIVIGDDEIKSKKFKIKNLKSGRQSEISDDNLDVILRQFD